jgi:hypothetical protein
MRQFLWVFLVVMLAACAGPDRYAPPPAERDGGIGGTGIVAE